MEEKKYPAENETLRAVVEMADNNQKRQRRQWLTGVSAAAAAFLLIIALFAIRHIHLDLTNPYRYTEELCGLIQQAEYTADGTWLYVTDAGQPFLGSPEAALSGGHGHFYPPNRMALCKLHSVTPPISHGIRPPYQ